MRLTKTLVFWVVMWGVAAHGHTTVIYPEREGGSTPSLLILHFHPDPGTDVMGVRLGAQDTPTLKGLASVTLIHQGRKVDLASALRPFSFSAGGTVGPAYRLALSPRTGWRGAGDYCVVVEHPPHWKPALGLYLKKVTKFYLNRGGRTTDWPHRLLEGMPEIIPLVEPFALPAGALFRGEVVDDGGHPLPHATLSIEYLNHAFVGDSLMEAPSFPDLDRASWEIRSDAQGTFAFIPTRPGSWTVTLWDGDRNGMVDGRELRFDSSLSLMVH